MRKKLLLIYNPRSGKGAVTSRLAEIIDTFTRGGYIVTACPTQGSQDATRIVCELAGEVDMIVCCGGDGTMDEVADGVIQTRPDVPVGYIPTGSTNDFGSSLSIPKDPVRAAQDIVEGTVHPCDIGCFNGMNFIYIAAFGLFTDVAYQTDQNLKNMIGHAAYLLEAGKRLFNVPAFHMHVTAEDIELEDDFVYGMITNARFVGGMKNLTGKNVDMADGLFEVRLVYPPQNPIELSEIFAALLNPNLTSEKIVTFKSAHISIESIDQVAWTLDGEYGGEHRIAEIVNQQHALNMVLNLPEEDEVDE